MRRGTLTIFISSTITSSHSKVIVVFNSMVFLICNTTAFCRYVVKCCQYLLRLFRFYPQIKLVLHYFQLCEMLLSSFSFCLQPSGLYFHWYACIVQWDLFLNGQISTTIRYLLSLYAQLQACRARRCSCRRDRNAGSTLPTPDQQEKTSQART